MAQAARAHVEEQQETADLAVMATVNPLAVFTDEKAFSEFYAKMKAEVEKHTPDVSTERGRAAVRSLAFRVTKAKTTLDKARLGLTEEWRKQIDVVNAAGKKMTSELDALAKETRQPLTEWEEAEKARVARCRAVIDGFKTAAIISIDDTSVTVRARGAEVYEVPIGDEFGDMSDEAQEAKDTAVATLGRALNRLLQEEADRAELARLRAEAEEREQAERERLAAEDEERRQREAEEAEAQRIREAEERAADEARRRAEEAKQVEVDEANRRAADAEAAAMLIEQQRERSRKIIQHCRDCANGIIGGQSQPFGILLHELKEKVTATVDEFGDFAPDVEQARTDALARVREVMDQHAARQEEERQAAEAARIAEEDRKREANKAHRSRVQKDAKEAIMACGCGEDVAIAIVKAIVAGKVPAVTLAF